MDPLASIIINNYNYGRFLGEAVESALNQDYSPVEVIVVDDGSTDHSPQVIDLYGDRIIPVLKENGGQASAFNAGFAASRGEIVCLLDADDIFRRSKITRVVQCFREHRNMAWLFHGLDYIDARGNCTGKYPLRQETGMVDIREEIACYGKMSLIAPPTSGLCFQRSLLQRLLPMPEAIKITADNYLKFAALTCAPGIYLNQVLAYQRIHGANAYTGCDNPYLSGCVHAQIAYYLALNIPDSQKFAVKLMAAALSDLIMSRSLKKRPGEVAAFLSRAGPGMKLKVYARCVVKTMVAVLQQFIQGLKAWK